MKRIDLEKTKAALESQIKEPFDLGLSLKLDAVISKLEEMPNKQEIKARIRSIRVDPGTWFEDDDPFHLYQQGKISKGRLIDLICDELKEGI